MSPKNREEPRERYVSPPWKPGEEKEARERIRAEVAKGVPVLVETGNDLEFTFLSAAVDAKGDLVLSCRITGSVTRPNGQWACKGESVSVSVPAKKIETSHEAS